MKSSPTSVVITGLGSSTPLGTDTAAMWRGLLAGRSGVRALGEPWAAGLPVRIAAQAAADPGAGLPIKGVKRLDRSAKFALSAALEAWKDAGLSPSAPGSGQGPRPEELAVVIGSALGSQQTMLDTYDTLKDKGPGAVSPYAVPMFLGNSAAAQVGLALGARAGVQTPVSACASGAEAVLLGLEAIRSGRAKVVLAGGTDANINALTMASFAAMHALSRRNEEPELASRPFAKDRDGFVLGEGAGVLVLESAEFARDRGAPAYCELRGGGLSSDSHHIARPPSDGNGLVAAMEAALGDAQVDSHGVGLINAHATSTPQGDLAEANALHQVFGLHAPRVPVCAPKSGMGHLLGAAGAVETVITALTLHHRLAPPVLNADDSLDSLDLALVRREPLVLPAEPVTALNHSLGFGGHNVVLALTTLAHSPRYHRS
ncbi:beta-ketoacyl-[acyl-carrier-protein] synthase family protein [Streptomyces sp. NPDC006879]|uniref:beta-ketoacyl-[acyl-carrier-protein] synthase family protein n=1 Tax=Streptomyces sp. NPDC006879 TaxID=3364767 RepID=UPI00367EA8A2